MAEDTLEEFLKDRQFTSGSECFVCNLPEEIQSQIESVIASGRRHWTAIAKWLVTIGQAKVSPDRIQRHFERGHHERNA